MGSRTSARVIHLSEVTLICVLGHDLQCGAGGIAICRSAGGTARLIARPDNNLLPTAAVLIDRVQKFWGKALPPLYVEVAVLAKLRREISRKVRPVGTGAIRSRI